ncbi:tetratricopeptide repeat protein [Gloeobacter kilaueensis]|uniref:Outer membrane subunit n=1 Tax=Gloeobacter kilaueensis (strain ATCC BAA-2537 / CCAP 1431/1 / ULC 316 / JS1) TaxID=1183438 RepID=U5QLH8_GLOK1|nr:outer membrane subunit [Gloeobacter kilaueensis]AGY59748.1 outer membrane subunit [Gloeobacter kilaueensis JS1]
MKSKAALTSVTIILVSCFFSPAGSVSAKVLQSEDYQKIRLGGSKAGYAANYDPFAQTPPSDRIEKAVQDLLEAANDHLVNGNKIKAVEEYTEAIKLDPTNYVSYYNRCFARNAIGEQDGALEDCNQALRLNSSCSYAYYIRGIIYIARKNKWAALDDLEHAATLFKSEGNYQYEAAARKRMKEAACPLCP